MAANQEGGFADEIKGFFSSLFGSSPAPVKRPTPAPAKTSTQAASSSSTPPVVKKMPKSLEDGWEIVSNKVDNSRSPGNIPDDLKRRPREGNWNYKDYITTEDYSQVLSDGPSSANSKNTLSRFQFIFMESDRVNLDHLRRCMWDENCHHKVRHTAWKIVLGYLPPWTFLDEPVIAIRRQRYTDTVRSLSRLIAGVEEDWQEKKALIRSGLSNTALKIPLFRSAKLSKMLERICQVWLLDNAEQPYVDTLTLIPLPITYAFLDEYGDVETMDVDRDLPDELVFQLEVDVYNCMSLLLKGDARELLNGSSKELITKLAKLVQAIDPALANHIESNVSYADFALAWFDRLLIDQFQKISLTVFMWDRYLASGKFVEYHITLCAYILLRFESQIKKLRAEELLGFLQGLPLHKWDYSHIEPLLDRVQTSKATNLTAPPRLDYAELREFALKRNALGLTNSFVSSRKSLPGSPSSSTSDLHASSSTAAITSLSSEGGTGLNNSLVSSTGRPMSAQLSASVTSSLSSSSSSPSLSQKYQTSPTR